MTKPPGKAPPKPSKKPSMLAQNKAGSTAAERAGKEKVTPPKADLVADRARKLPKGGGSAPGRILAEERVAVQQKVRTAKKP